LTSGENKDNPKVAEAVGALYKKHYLDKLPSGTSIDVRLLFQTMVRTNNDCGWDEFVSKILHYPLNLDNDSELEKVNANSFSAVSRGPDWICNFSLVTPSLEAPEPSFGFVGHAGSFPVVFKSYSTSRTAESSSHNHGNHNVMLARHIMRSSSNAPHFEIVGALTQPDGQLEVEYYTAESKWRYVIRNYLTCCCPFVFRQRALKKRTSAATTINLANVSSTMQSLKVCSAVALSSDAAGKGIMSEGVRTKTLRRIGLLKTEFDPYALEGCQILSSNSTNKADQMLAYILDKTTMCIALQPDEGIDPHKQAWALKIPPKRNAFRKTHTSQTVADGMAAKGFLNATDGGIVDNTGIYGMVSDWYSMRPGSMASSDKPGVIFSVNQTTDLAKLFKGAKPQDGWDGFFANPIFNALPTEWPVRIDVSRPDWSKESCEGDPVPETNDQEHPLSSPGFTGCWSKTLKLPTAAGNLTSFIISKTRVTTIGDLTNPAGFTESKEFILYSMGFMTNFSTAQIMAIPGYEARYLQYTKEVALAFVINDKQISDFMNDYASEVAHQ
jgi:hypothetical protein